MRTRRAPGVRLLVALSVGMFSMNPASAQPEALGGPQRAALNEFYLNIRDGTKTTFNPSAIRESAQAAEVQLQPLTALLREGARSATGTCARFLAVSNGLTNDLQAGLAGFAVNPRDPTSPADSDFEISNRLQIAIAAFSEMEFLIRSGAEGGYSTLDWNVRKSCELPHREQLMKAFDSSLEKLSTFFTTTFGHPGLAQIESAQQRLLRLSADAEKDDQQKLLAILAAGTAASVALWRFGPEVALRSINLFFGYTPRILAIPAFLYGVKVSALVAEGATFSYADTLASSTVDPPRSIIGSWEEHMNAINVFVKSPVHSPELQLALLSRVQTLAFPDALAALTVYAPELKSRAKTEGGPSVQSSIDSIELLQILAGANIPEQTRRLANWVKVKFNYNLRCDSGVWFGTGDAECLLGMRTFATSAIAKEIPPPVEPVTVKISQKFWQGVDALAKTPEVAIPFTASGESMARFFVAEYNKAGYLQRIDFLNRIDDLKHELEGLTEMKFDIGERLTNLQVVSGLYQLILLARENPKIYSARAEVIKVTDHFKLPYEENLKLKEDLDVTAGLTELRRYLVDDARSSRDYNGDPNWPDGFFGERFILEGVQKQLAAEGFGKVVCSSDANLTQAQCLYVLQKLERNLPKDLHLPKTDLLLIGTPSELSYPAEYEIDGRSQKAVLYIRSNIKKNKLAEFFVARGWSKEGRQEGGVP